ncbi:MAG: hypothetical protein DDT42_02162 [candidate division WS2 bacterium]|uniref:Uncharacterized protein n=1 Tax=Psychracetigena formicireducens TaxID=2986056 RepID=A0A9E2F7D4_PSYF1|nr:hypothetical protein [Candidatus Psychracetigena formicireducens]
MIWGAFPEEIQEMILSKVRKGTGLVYTANRLSTLKADLTPINEGREIFSGIPSIFLPLLNLSKRKGGRSELWCSRAAANLNTIRSICREELFLRIFYEYRSKGQPLGR